MTDKEINEAVGRKLGLKQKAYYHTQDWFLPNGNQCGLPDYCHSISAAWEIVSLPGMASQCVGYVTGKWEWMLYPTDNKGPFIGKADTAPMAIALAFLKLNGGDNG